MKAYLYATESAWRSLRGEDPRPAIQEGKTTLEKAVSLAPDDNTIQSSQTLIALAEARWQVDHRQSPDQALAASRQAISRSGKLTQEHRGSLAIGHALQGRWIRLKGGDAKPMGQAGLDALKIGKPEAIRDPSMFILLAVLHDLKGDSKEARIMLDKAVQKNPFAAQGPFFIRTSKELKP